MIRLEKVSFAYNPEKPIFVDFDWKVEPGESWALLGSSGCGKSTLLYLLAGLIRPTSGAVFIGNEPLNQPRPQTGLILQDYGLLPWATVRQNVSLGLRLRQFYGPDGKHAPRIPVSSADQTSVEAWIERLGLTAVANQFPGQISGGQRQRTAIARTLSINPDLLLMDEPFASLDAPTREGLQRLVLQLQAETGLTLVLVTHSLEEAAFMGKKILVLAPPPNNTPRVILNPRAGGADYTGTSEYLVMCETLRSLLERPQA